LHPNDVRVARAHPSALARDFPEGGELGGRGVIGIRLQARHQLLRRQQRLTDARPVPAVEQRPGTVLHELRLLVDEVVRQ
jgi:hypothetical protein